VQGKPIGEWYGAYLRNPDWKKTRRQAMHLFGNCCLCCRKYDESTASLRVHHLNYDHLGAEIPGVDVIVVCRKCKARIRTGKVRGIERLAIGYFKRIARFGETDGEFDRVRVYREFLQAFKERNGYRLRADHEPT
jgi:hypothetical protein